MAVRALERSHWMGFNGFRFAGAHSSAVYDPRETIEDGFLILALLHSVLIQCCFNAGPAS